jgi:hypothetical protein
LEVNFDRLPISRRFGELHETGTRVAGVDGGGVASVTRFRAFFVDQTRADDIEMTGSIFSCMDATAGFLVNLLCPLFIVAVFEVQEDTSQS